MLALTLSRLIINIYIVESVELSKMVVEQVGVEGALLELHEFLQGPQLLQPRLLLPLQHPSHLVHAHLPIPAFPRQQQALLVEGRLERVLLRGLGLQLLVLVGVKQLVLLGKGECLR